MDDLEQARLLDEMSRLAADAVARIQRGDPALDALDRLTERWAELTAHSSQAALLTAREKLSELLQQLHVAQGCARVVLRDLGDQLAEASREDRARRAYQAQATR